ncbi:MAG: ABC transporter permease [Steroidobacteraceae bacterium]
MSNWFSQIVTITLTNLRSISERKAASIVAVVGIAGVVAILVGVLSMREGFRVALDQAGSKDVAIVMRSGSATELSSGLSLDQTRIISGAGKVMKQGDMPIASPELYVIVDVPMRSTGTGANVPLRGVGDQAAKVRSKFKLVSGRMFTPGRFEVIVGLGAAAQFSGLEVGKTVRWGTTDWQVVGQFEDGGSVSESEIWTDATVLQGAYRRGSSFQSVRVQLAAPDDIKALKDELTADPRLNISVRSEADYYAEQSKSLATLINVVGYTVAFLMGLGAVFGALNTMYSAVSARTREIATLRALGFGAWPVVSSVVTESLLLGLIGGSIGCVIALLGFNGIRASTLNWSSFSQITFAFAVTPALLGKGLLYALVLSFFGGIMPGIRAAKLPIVSGLREL